MSERSSTRAAPASRDGFRFFHALTTRWHDNDVYGHVNNVVYYAWLDTAVAMYLTSRGLVDVARSTVVGIVVETGLRYHAPITFPDTVAVGLRIARLGTSSVRYEAGMFRGAEDSASAEGHFTHVYVDRATMRPVPMRETTRRALSDILVA